MKKPLRIAIADDEADIRQYLRRLLPRLGHRVVGEAEDGRKLIDICRTESPDLVITDIMMPGMDGIEATVEIGKTQKVPIIIVSSHDPPEQNRHASVVDFLVKPISIAELEKAIDKAMGQ